jgi:hypothetical protein
MLQRLAARRTFAFVSDKQRLASPSRGRAWTRPEDYLDALARKRSFRRAHREKMRTEPERPRLMLSTVPFLMLVALLGILAIAIMIIALPGAQPQPKESPALVKERGVAARGWFQEAQKEMRH